MLDLVTTGDLLHSSRSALRLLETQCQASLVRREDDAKVEALACPGACGGDARGSCDSNRGTCSCKAGFIGEDCMEDESGKDY